MNCSLADGLDCTSFGEGVLLFARKCSVTGKGMNEGYCIGDGDMYIEKESDMVKHISESTEYKDINEAYADEYYYHTDWYSTLDDPDELDEAYDEDGNLYWFIDKHWVKHEYPFKEGDTYFTIEEDDVVKSCWDSESENLFNQNPKRNYFRSRKDAYNHKNLVYRDHCSIEAFVIETIAGFTWVLGDKSDETRIDILNQVIKNIETDYGKYLMKKFALDNFKLKI